MCDPISGAMAFMSVMQMQQQQQMMPEGEAEMVQEGG